jgi:hypothetical protein
MGRDRDDDVHEPQRANLGYEQPLVGGRRGKWRARNNSTNATSRRGRRGRVAALRRAVGRAALGLA